jgi:ParB family transcriptional regulator, chromosome partitioning protein
MTPTRTEPTAEQEEEIKTLTAKAEGIVAEHGDEPADEAAFNELASALNRIEELSAGEQVWTLEQKAVSGVLVTIGHSGELQIKRGLIKPEDKAAARKVQGVTREAQDEKPKPAKEKGGLSAALVAEVTSHKTAAARLELANNANVALLAVTHALALRAFYNPYDQHTSLKIVAHETTFPMAINEQIEKSTAGNKFATTVKAWRKKLPKEPGQLWDWLSEQKRDVVLGLLAVSAATTVDMVQPHGVKADAAADALMTALKADMAGFWTATADNYLGRVSKDLIRAAVEEACGEGETTGLPTKKAELAKAAEKKLKGKGWVPAVLQVG